MFTLQATLPLTMPPEWAVLQRQLFQVMDQSISPFLNKYTRADGTLIWRDQHPGRDGADDGYESFHNWPLLYTLGGGDFLGTLSIRQWEAITRQFTAYGQIHQEYEQGYDWFHQGESYLYFYYLGLAAPDQEANRDRARRFAGFYLNEDPAAPNYDPERRLIRSAYCGSRGPAIVMGGAEPKYGWSASMVPYGIPFEDVPGIRSYDDLKDPALARRMGEAMRARMGQGDVAANLAATSLMTHAYLFTGEERYRQWVLDYVEAWIERARANGGLLPDNIGLSGRIGETMNGKWWGGYYGWTWPHGFYNIGMAAIIAASNALLLTGDFRYLDLPRAQIDGVLQHAVEKDGELLVPYRYSDSGWFEYHVLDLLYPTAVWYLSMDAADWARLERLRRSSRTNWREVRFFRNKHDDGHEAPWLCFLQGGNPGYPEAILRENLGQVYRRMQQVREDSSDLARVNIHHWQELNPVLTEALVQLTLGAPQVVYNGGLLHCRVRYRDAERGRPGLPEGVAALVDGVGPDRASLRLVNLSPDQTRKVILQAGAFGEHRFDEVAYTARTSDYPGARGSYEPPVLQSETRRCPVRSSLLEVILPPGTEVRLDLATSRFVHRPAYASPPA
ncbi:MAG: hypothetical protein HYU36_04180 [Planctomycetes bacterium]|nr:hypothetical protein [Planctomycetota bacterium]